MFSFFIIVFFLILFFALLFFVFVSYPKTDIEFAKIILGEDKFFISNKKKKIINLSIRKIYYLKKRNDKSRKEFGGFHWIITDACLDNIRGVIRCKNIQKDLYLVYFLKTPEIIKQEKQINLIESMGKEITPRSEGSELNLFYFPNSYLF